MDPSEYEDTVEKSADVISAGALEKYFADDVITKQNNIMEGLLKSLSLTLKAHSSANISNSNNSSVPFPSAELWAEWENLVIEVTEYDEKEHRETLMSALRDLAEKLNDTTACNKGPASEDANCIAVGAGDAAVAGVLSVYRDVETVFLREFDSAAERRRIYEAFLLRGYKQILAQPPQFQSQSPSQSTMLDTAAVLTEVCAACEQIIALSSSQDARRSRADSSSDDADADGAAALALAAEEKVSPQERLERESLRLNVQNRAQSDRVQTSFLAQAEADRRTLALQQDFDAALQRKDAEIADLMEQLHDQRQQTLETAAKDAQFEELLSSYKEARAGHNACLTQLSEAQASFDACRAQQVRQAEEYELFRAAVTKREAETAVIGAALKEEAASLQRQVQDCEARLRALPTVADVLSLLAKCTAAGNSSVFVVSEGQGQGKDKDSSSHSSEAVTIADLNRRLLAYTAAQQDGDHNHGGSGTSSSSAAGGGGGKGFTVTGYSWSAIEGVIWREQRRLELQLVQYRVDNEELQLQVDRLSHQYATCAAELESKRRTVASLEQDVLAAQGTIEAGQAIIRGFATATDKSKFVLSSMSAAVGARGVQAPAGAVVVPAGSSGGCDSDLSDLFAAADSADLSSSAAADIGDNASGVYSGSDAAARMLQALTSQRDRYMQQARRSESEANALRSQGERQEEEQRVLRAENVELFKRLRYLRMNGNSSGGGSSSSSGTGQGGRRRVGGAGTGVSAVADIEDARGTTTTTATMDGLESKYSTLYEEQLSPFQLLEIDRYFLLTKMTCFERGLAALTKYVIQDHYSRHLFLLYLFLLHLFAMGYVWQVLNPEIIDEMNNPHKQ